MSDALMRRSGRQITGPWSILLIVLTIAGAGLDALPATLLLGAPGRQDIQDDGTDDVDGADDLASPQIHVRRSRFAPVGGFSPVEPLAPRVARRATTSDPADGPTERLSVLLCRFRC